MKTALHRLLGGIRFVVIAGGGILCIALTATLFTVQGVPAWPWFLDLLRLRPELGLVGGAGLVALEGLYWLTLPRRRVHSQLTYRTKQGTVSVDLEAVKEDVEDLAEEYNDLHRLGAEIFPRRRGMDVELHLHVTRGAHVPDLCQSLQNRVRQIISDHLGLFPVKYVRIHIEKLIKTDVPAETADDRESAQPAAQGEELETS
jgi:uncharacterized alkaline shock family protein YloU